MLASGLVALAFSGCAADRPPQPFQAHLTVWNRNSVSPDQPDFYEILGLYAHGSPDFPVGATSLIDTPLAIDATIAFEFTSENYVSAVRRRNTGENIALTTGTGLTIDSSCYVLEVFDDAFRLLENGDVALPALAAAGFDATCTVNPVDGGADGGAGGDPTPGD